MGFVKVKLVWPLRLALLIALTMVLDASGIAASVSPHALSSHHAKPRSVTENQHARRRMRTLAHSRAPLSKSVAHRHRYYERFYTSSFASDITEGDVRPAKTRSSAKLRLTRSAT